MTGLKDVLNNPASMSAVNCVKRKFTCVKETVSSVRCGFVALLRGITSSIRSSYNSYNSRDSFHPMRLRRIIRREMQIIAKA
jgi:hypothetical protein